MSFYHFHLRTADGLERDEIGMRHPNLEAAYLDACRAIPSLMAERGGSVCLNSDLGLDKWISCRVQAAAGCGSLLK